MKNYLAALAFCLSGVVLLLPEGEPTLAPPEPIFEEPVLIDKEVEEYTPKWFDNQPEAAALNKPVIILVSQEGCAPCIRLKKLIESNELHKEFALVVNTWEALGINGTDRSVPKLFILSANTEEGTVAEAVTVPRTQKQLTKLLKRYL